MMSDGRFGTNYEPNIYTNELLNVDDYTKEWGYNHDGKYQECGEWAFPIFPACRSLQGSPPTPYIFDDRCRFEDAGDKLKEVYDLPKEERVRRGLLGREFVLREDIGMSSKHMNERFIKDMDWAFENFKPRKQFELSEVI